MNDKEIKALLEAFLKAHFKGQSDFSTLSRLSEEHHYAPYTALVALFEHLNGFEDGFFPLQEIANTVPPESHPAFENIVAVLSDGVTFQKETFPSEIKSIEFERIERGYLSRSPVVDGDYTERETFVVDDGQINRLRETALKCLSKVYEGVPNKDRLELPKNLSEVTTAKLNSVITDLGNMKKRGPLNPKGEALFALCKQVRMLRALSVISIPREGSKDESYCKIPEVTEGATEKVSLVSRETVMERLQSLIDTVKEDAARAYQTYSRAHATFKIPTEAIIKLPKPHPITFLGAKKTEVQKEHIALNMGRLLFENVTSSTMLLHDGVPALFVPFDNIKELREMARGEVNRKYYVGGEYFVDSTLNPVGEGLKGVSTDLVDDFGDKLAYFFLCSDPDAVGAYNQNKGLIDDKHFYVFDQVVMKDDFFTIDSSLSLTPLSTTSRHTEGRNRSIIEDSSLNQKLDSVYQLIDKAGLIDKMMGDLIRSHEEKIRSYSTKKTLSTGDKQVLADLKILKKDAESIQARIQMRIKHLKEKVLIPGLDRDHTRQVLVLQKLLNKPVLFNSLGRPYRFPFTENHTIKVKSVERQLAFGGPYVLKFDAPPPIEMIEYINLRLGPRAAAVLNDAIIISEENLKKIEEGLLYPEYGKPFSDTEHYLEPNELSCLKKIYPQTIQGEKMFSRVMAYQRPIEGVSPKEQVRAISDMLGDIDKVLFSKKRSSVEDPGFLMHLKLKLRCDAQQKIIQHCLREVAEPQKQNLKTKLIKAFDVAVKLDRIGEFQAVCLSALDQGFNKDPRFYDYLDGVIALGDQAQNYSSGVTASKALSTASAAQLALIHKPRNALGEFIKDAPKEKSPSHATLSHEEWVALGVEDISDCASSTLEESDVDEKEEEAPTGGDIRRDFR